MLCIVFCRGGIESLARHPLESQEISLLGSKLLAGCELVATPHQSWVIAPRSSGCRGDHVDIAELSS